MPRSTVGLLAALCAVTSALVGLVHGGLVPLMLLATGAAAWCSASLASRHIKKSGVFERTVI